MDVANGVGGVIRAPPGAQHPGRRPANVIGGDRVDQRRRRWAAERQAVLARDVAVDDPIAVMFLKM